MCTCYPEHKSVDLDGRPNPVLWVSQGQTLQSNTPKQNETYKNKHNCGNEECASINIEWAVLAVCVFWQGKKSKSHTTVMKVKAINKCAPAFPAGTCFKLFWVVFGVCFFWQRKKSKSHTTVTKVFPMWLNDQRAIIKWAPPLNVLVKIGCRRASAHNFWNIERRCPLYGNALEETIVTVMGGSSFRPTVFAFIEQSASTKWS